MSYLFFSADKARKFDKGDGTEGTLGEHLDYLANYGGSPDCWDYSDTDSRAKAIGEAKESGLHLYVVDDCQHRVVGVVNKPKEM